MPSYLSLLADALMIAASAGAAVYCLVLSRRLSRLTGFDSGIGGAIAVLSVQVEEMKTALAAAKAGSDGAGAHLRELVGQAQQISSELELMIAACHDFAEQAPAAPAPAPVVLPADVARTLQEAMAEVMALRHDLDARAAALAEREAAVALAQDLVEARLAELAEAESRLEALIAVSDAAAETDLDRLTRVYETMDPDTAAELFAQMPPSFAAGFLARMTPPASAALMAAMTPEQAYAVSVVLATRNSSAPRFATGESGAVDTER
jgi:flagellar motility protein MotE (MotC chaperone)